MLGRHRKCFQGRWLMMTSRLSTSMKSCRSCCCQPLQPAGNQSSAPPRLYLPSCFITSSNGRWAALYVPSLQSSVSKLCRHLRRPLLSTSTSTRCLRVSVVVSQCCPHATLRYIQYICIYIYITNVYIS